MSAVAIFFHVTPAANRDSILRHGLDWRLGGGGIAGSREPEKPGVFLARDEHEADFFIQMGERRFPALDLWEITLDHDAWGNLVGGEVLIQEFDGFICWMQAIAPSRLRLRERDVSRPRRESADDGSVRVTMTFTPTAAQAESTRRRRLA
jgi:hypothetical protein